MRWQKEKDPLSPGKSLDGKYPFTPLSLLGALAVLFTLVSFFLWEGGTGAGEISRTVSYFADFFDENEAIAVFLGWEGE